jgi:hypothetical protein
MMFVGMLMMRRSLLNLSSEAPLHRASQNPVAEVRASHALKISTLKNVSGAL